MSSRRAGLSRRRDEESDNEEEEEQQEVVQEEEQGRKTVGMSPAELESAAAQMVRLALFHEYKRSPLQRKTVTSLVLPTQPRLFPSVLRHAQYTLERTFGMELHELRTKQKLDEGAEPQTQKRGKRRADGAEEESAAGPAVNDAESQRAARGAKGSGSYILRSILPPDVVEGMANPVPLPVGENLTPAELAEREADSGALVQWEKGDGTASGSIALLGVRTVILCLILCLGRVAQDNTLHGFLRRLNLHRDTVLPYKSADVAGDPMTLDKYLDLLAKQNYLEKAKVNNPTGEGTVIEWRWGSREAEFSEAAAASFIESIFLGEEDESSDEEEQPTSNGSEPRLTGEQRREAKRRKLRNHLERVAGGPLLGTV